MRLTTIGTLAALVALAMTPAEALDCSQPPLEDIVDGCLKFCSQQRNAALQNAQTNAARCNAEKRFIRCIVLCNNGCDGFNCISEVGIYLPITVSGCPAAASQFC